jgi:hypothetical protein
MGKGRIRLFEEVIEESKIQEDIIITSVEECKEALETIAGFLQDLNIAIEENYVAEMLDSFPGNPLREGNLIPKEVSNIESYSKSTVSISKGISNFLTDPSNRNSTLSNLNTLVRAVNRYSYDVGSILDQHQNSFPEGSQLRSWINTFNVILRTFNMIIEEINTHNFNTTSNSEEWYDPIPVPNLK